MENEADIGFQQALQMLRGEATIQNSPLNTLAMDYDNTPNKKEETSLQYPETQETSLQNLQKSDYDVPPRMNLETPGGRSHAESPVRFDNTALSAPERVSTPLLKSPDSAGASRSETPILYDKLDVSVPPLPAKEKPNLFIPPPPPKEMLVPPLPPKEKQNRFAALKLDGSVSALPDKGRPEVLVQFPEVLVPTLVSNDQVDMGMVRGGDFLNDNGNSRASRELVTSKGRVEYDLENYTEV